MSASKLFTLHPFTFSFKRIVFFCKTASTSGFYSTSVNLSSLKIESISYKSHGVPSKVLNLETSFLPSKFDEHSVLVKLLAAPVNPSDINQIEGVYAILPKLPAVGGNEGVGEVLQIGSKVTSLQVGDWVVPAQAGSGTWRTHMLGAHNEFTRIPNDLS
ncbi:enoyl-[acyl-carrier-protein] reductase, mitochondrial-like, partial [Zophobas morio]|uniref:enoyl-[acyl-carrier-protein] reductase, mitochondrial-like n=1 Tax=Zophobas morio TaxID=2755281 RepID=UPI003082ADA4